MAAANPIPLSLVVEDALSEAVCHRLISDTHRDYHVSTVYSRGGKTWIQSKLQGLNRASKGVPFLILTDLDDETCPQSLRQNWLGGHPMESNLIFRVAVREVETWLFADAVTLARHIRVRKALLEANPEQVTDPKQFLINAARNSTSRRIREGLVPAIGSTARIGPDYNGILIQFVAQKWNTESAALRSDSLRRMRETLGSFVPTWPTST